MRTRILGYVACFAAGAVAGAALLFAASSMGDGEDTAVAMTACEFEPPPQAAAFEAPAVTVGPGARPPSAPVRTVVAESVVELRVRVCFRSGATLTTAGSGVLISEGPPWRLLTAAHVVDASSWEPVREVQVEVRRQGAFQSGPQPAKIVRVAHEADIAELEIQMDEGVVWQAATAPPLAARGPRQGETLTFVCFFERDLRLGAVVNTVRRAGDTETYELDVGSGSGCSGAGAVNAGGELAGIVIQANEDVTRISSIQALR